MSQALLCLTQARHTRNRIKQAQVTSLSYPAWAQITKIEVSLAQARPSSPNSEDPL